MKELGCFHTVKSMLASELQPRDFPKKYGGFMAISQSGNSMDLVIPFRMAYDAGLTRFNIVNKANSILASECPIGAYIKCGRESSVASTKAFTCQVIVNTLVAIWFA